MSTFVFIHHAPMSPEEAAPPSPEQVAAIMGDQPIPGM
jgi:hypothetical protein